MANESNPNQHTPDIFHSARWYDLGINWDARLGREIPVLCDVMGPPEALGILDAGCGPGRQVAALAGRGYRVIGLDLSPEMVEVAREHVRSVGVEAALVAASFENIAAAGGPFDGIYCLGNSLAATGSAAAAEKSVAAIATALRPGGRLFIQILNFDKLRAERPKVRGPRVRQDGGVEYISNRVFFFDGDNVEVTNITVWNDNGWKNFAQSGSLYAISRAAVERWCAAGGVVIDELWGSYARETFDAAASNDLIVVGTKKT